MPVPDVSRPARVDGKCAFLSTAVANTNYNFFTVAANSICRVRSVIIANPQAATYTATLFITRGGTAYYIAPGVSLLTKSIYTAIVIDEAVYMEPGDVLSGSANIAGMHFTVSYEIIT